MEWIEVAHLDRPLAAIFRRYPKLWAVPDIDERIHEWVQIANAVMCAPC